MKQTLTHSRMSCFRACPRKHWLRYEIGLKSDEESIPLKFGRAMHLAFECSDKGCSIDVALSDIEDSFLKQMVLATYYHHQKHYRDRDHEFSESRLTPIAAEVEFKMALINPETGSPTPIWDLRGVIDRIVKLDDGRLALKEYKTTGFDFSSGAEYWQRLHMDQQLTIYVMAAREAGYDIQTILYDVTRRPSLRPLLATPKDKQKFKSDGVLYANQRLDDEGAEAYGLRIAADIEKRPEHYFARIEIPRLDTDILECQSEIWQQQLALRQAQRSKMFYRNPNSCFGFSKCEYIPICMNSDLAYNTPVGFTRVSDIHPELGVAPDEG